MSSQSYRTCTNKSRRLVKIIFVTFLLLFISVSFIALFVSPNDPRPRITPSIISEAELLVLLYSLSHWFSDHSRIQFGKSSKNDRRSHCAVWVRSCAYFSLSATFVIWTVVLLGLCLGAGDHIERMLETFSADLTAFDLSVNLSYN